eukprot:scaffold4640_cov63-Phaeocystis_antarctica.AAC.2
MQDRLASHLQQGKWDTSPDAYPKRDDIRDDFRMYTRSRRGLGLMGCPQSCSSMVLTGPSVSAGMFPRSWIGARHSGHAPFKQYIMWSPPGLRTSLTKERSDVMETSADVCTCSRRHATW